jgi:hypothetical protein
MMVIIENPDPDFSGGSCISENQKVLPPGMRPGIENGLLFSTLIKMWLVQRASF